jgi:hypothetical protein
MSETAVTLWAGNVPVRIPPHASSAEEIVPCARQLTARDRQHIVNAFNHESYEMVATFVWNKALTSLKAQLGRLGATFVAEMLDRPDMTEGTPIEQKLTDYEALRLAQELGFVRGTGAFRLRQAFERITHFGSLPPEEAEEEQFTATEAIDVLRACVENVLGFERTEAALDFKRFRDSLSGKVLEPSDPSIEKLQQSPYFFHRASIRMLLSVVKTAVGALLENALANANVIIPTLWPGVLQPERYQIGRAYSELVANGQSTAAAGLRKVLLKVKGFDFVPEDLRSTSFVKAAHEVLAAHDGSNNYYNEPGPTRTLERMGTAIPIPAFPICMSAVLSVRLGNAWGDSWDAQTPATAILKRLSPERWVYYLDQCLPTDDRILYKLLSERPASRWSTLVEEFSLRDHLDDLRTKETRQLLADSAKPSSVKFSHAVKRLILALGYAAG